MSIKISALNSSNLPLVGNEIIPLVQGSETKKSSIDNIVSSFFQKKYTVLENVLKGQVAGLNAAGLAGKIKTFDSERGIIVDTLKVENKYYVLKGTAPGESGEDLLLNLEVYLISGEELTLISEIEISDLLFRLDYLIFGGIRMFWSPFINRIIFSVELEQYSKLTKNIPLIDTTASEYSLSYYTFYVNPENETVYFNDGEYFISDAVFTEDDTYLVVIQKTPKDTLPEFTYSRDDYYDFTRFVVVAEFLESNGEFSIDVITDSEYSFDENSGPVQIFWIDTLGKLLLVPYFGFESGENLDNKIYYCELISGELSRTPITLFSEFVGEGNGTAITNFVYFRGGVGIITTLDFNDEGATAPIYKLNLNTESLTEIEYSGFLFPINNQLKRYSIIDGNFVIISGISGDTENLGNDSSDTDYSSLVLQFDNSNNIINSKKNKMVDFTGIENGGEQFFSIASTIRFDKITDNFLLTKHEFIENKEFDEFYVKFSLTPVTREGVDLIISLENEPVTLDRSIGVFAESGNTGTEVYVKLFGPLEGFENLDPGKDYYLDPESYVITNSPKIVERKGIGYNYDAGEYYYTVKGNGLKIGKAIDNNTLFINPVVEELELVADESDYYDYYDGGDGPPPIDALQQYTFYLPIGNATQIISVWILGPVQLGKTPYTNQDGTGLLDNGTYSYFPNGMPPAYDVVILDGVIIEYSEKQK